MVSKRSHGEIETHCLALYRYKTGIVSIRNFRILTIQLEWETTQWSHPTMSLLKTCITENYVEPHLGSRERIKEAFSKGPETRLPALSKFNVWKTKVRNVIDWKRRMKKWKYRDRNETQSKRKTHRKINHLTLPPRPSLPRTERTAAHPHPKMHPLRVESGPASPTPPLDASLSPHVETQALPQRFALARWLVCD